MENALQPAAFPIKVHLRPAWPLALLLLLVTGQPRTSFAQHDTSSDRSPQCPASLPQEAQRLMHVATDPATDSTTRLAALNALGQLPDQEAVCALAALLCSQTGLPGDLRNRLELDLVERSESALFALAHWLDSGSCHPESASALFGRIMRRLPELLVDLCAIHGRETCYAVALGIAFSGHPSSSTTLSTLYLHTDKPQHRAAILQAICPQAAEACLRLLPPSLEPGTDSQLAGVALEAIGSLCDASCAQLAAPWLNLDALDLTLVAIESLAIAGSHGLEQTLFDLLTKAPASMKDPILLALAAGDADRARPLLQRAFAAAPPASPEQHRLAQWLLADTPDILFRGNAPETTPVFAQAAPHSKATCLLTLRNQEGMKVAVDGKLRLICATSSKTYVYEQNRFNDAGMLEFPCLCEAGTRPDAAWITTEDVILQIQWR